MSRILELEKLTSDERYRKDSEWSIERKKMFLLEEIAASLAVIADTLTENKFANGNDPVNCETCRYAMEPTDIWPCNRCVRYSNWEANE